MNTQVALYHVMSRGNERKAIFQNNDDRKMFLTLLGETAERFDLDEVYAYVLMTNHYHIPKEINPEKSEQRYLMKTLDIHDLIDQTAGIFNFDWKQTKNQARLTGQDKIMRDMLMLLLWEQGAFKNEEIGNAMGISHSGVSKKCIKVSKKLVEGFFY